MQDTPELRAKKAARWDQLVAEGKSSEEAVAIVEQEFGSGQSTAQAMGVPDPSKVDPKKIASAIAGLVAGGGVGSLTAKMLAGKVGAKFLGRALTGAASGVAGGATARAIQTPGGVKERAKSAADPLMMGLDATVGGVVGGALGMSPGANKKAAHELGETIPRVARKGVPNEIAKVAGVSVEDPLAVQQKMVKGLNSADAQRFAFLRSGGGGKVTDPNVLAEYRELQKLFPEIDDMALRTAQLEAKATGSVFDPEGLIEEPTLQYLHYVKQALAKPEGLVEVRAASGKPLGKTDLRFIKQIGNNFRDVLRASNADYDAAVSASRADREAINALETGVKAAKPSSKAIGKNPTSPAAIANDVTNLSTPTQKNPSPVDHEAARKAFVGELSLSPDPLKRINTGTVRDKARELLGVQGVRDIDKATAPWEEAMDLSNRLQSSGVDLATRFGTSGAIGGNPQAAKTAFGAQVFNALARGHRIGQARKLSPLFQSSAPGTDTDDFLAILKALADARKRKAFWGGTGAGIATSGLATVLPEQ